jgi:segregation and condensation protein A
MSRFDSDESTEVVGTSPIQVNLPAFDGPLDLLLHLIKRDEVNIYDIPIAHITEQYLSYIGMMSLLDLEVAGDFLVMAATLMRIKARMLLPPKPGQTDDDDEFIDPRDELVRQLLEYRRFKEAAGQLQSAEESRRHVFERGFIPPIGSDELPELAPVSLFTLLDVLKDVVARVGEEFFHEVVLEEVGLEEKIALVESELAATGRVLFRDLLLRFPRRMHAVVTLMAILELSRLGRIAVRQEGLFGEIWIYHTEEAPPDPMLAGLERHDGTAGNEGTPGNAGGGPEESPDGTR